MGRLRVTSDDGMLAMLGMLLGTLRLSLDVVCTGMSVGQVVVIR